MSEKPSAGDVISQLETLDNLIGTLRSEKADLEGRLAAKEQVAREQISCAVERGKKITDLERQLAECQERNAELEVDV